MRDSQKSGDSYYKDDRSSIKIDDCACLFRTSAYLYGRSPAAYSGVKEARTSKYCLFSCIEEFVTLRGSHSMCFTSFLAISLLLGRTLSKPYLYSVQMLLG